MSLTKIDDIPALVAESQEAIDKHHGDAVEKARQIGELLAYAKTMLRGKYEKWSTENIKLGSRMIRNYKRLHASWHVIEIAKANKVFGEGDDQFRYNIVGCLKCIQNSGKVIRKKKGKRQERKVTVDPTLLATAAKKAKISSEAAQVLMAELGFSVSLAAAA